MSGTDQPKILVNAANVHKGGGVAVASSFLAATIALGEANRLSVMASDEVHNNLERMDLKPLEHFAQYIRANTCGMSAMWTKAPISRRDFDVVFTVFGPDYGIKRGPANVVGIAQGWVVYPRNEAYSKLPRHTRVKWRAKYAVQALFFSRADVLVAEAEHVKEALGKQGLFKGIPTYVVPNCADGLFWQPARWLPLDLPPKRGDIRLGLVSRAQPHKNLEVFPQVHRELKERHGLNAEFLVTLEPAHWDGMSPEFHACVTNIGPLSLPQVPTFLQGLDAVLFPTLLECYSATPAEAAAIGKPLFASDRPFLHETSGSNVIWIDPLRPSQIADAVADFLAKWDKTKTATPGTEPAWSALDRAKAYLDVCRTAFEGGEPRESAGPRDL